MKVLHGLRLYMPPLELKKCYLPHLKYYIIRSHPFSNEGSSDRLAFKFHGYRQTIFAGHHYRGHAKQNNNQLLDFMIILFPRKA